MSEAQSGPAVDVVKPIGEDTMGDRDSCRSEVSSVVGFTSSVEIVAVVVLVVICTTAF